MNKLQESVFKLLKLKPNEPFKLKEFKYKKFILTESLEVRELGSEQIGSSKFDFDYISFVRLADILNGDFHIDYPISSQDQTILDYAKLLGFDWIAVERSGGCYIFHLEPHKEGFGWDGFGKTYLDIAPSFLSWDDEKAYYIGDT